MSDIHPVTWMYIIFIVPLGIAAVAYLCLQVYLRIKRRQQRHIITVESADGRRFSLFESFDSPGVLAFHVYEIEKNENPPSGSNADSIYGRLLFVSSFMKMLDPMGRNTLSLHKDRHLVFERDGIYHSLYDVKENTIEIHEPDTQTEYANWAEKELGSGVFSEEAYVSWLKRNFHEPIIKRINDPSD